MRRLIPLLCLLACGKSAPPPATIDAAPAPLARPLDRPVIDAGPDEPEAPPIRPGDVLSGPEAEKALATQLTPPIDAGPAAAAGPDFAITATGAGPFHLGMTRADVLAHAKSAAFRRVRLPTAAAPGIEVATVPSAANPILQLRLYAGRVAEIEVLARTPRAATDGEITVGSTFAQAEDEHGDPILMRDITNTPRGWMMSELPGVIFAPTDGTLLSQDSPPPSAHIGRILILRGQDPTP